MNTNAFANGRYGPTSGPRFGRFPTIGSAANGHISSTVTAPEVVRNNAPTPTPSTVAIAAYRTIAPMKRCTLGSVNDGLLPTRGGAADRATSIDATTIITVKMHEKTTATTALAANTRVRLGVAIKV